MSVQYSSALSRTPMSVELIPEYKTLSTVIKSCFKVTTPSIPEIVGDYLNLRKVAETLSFYLEAIRQDPVQMTENGVLVIERSIQYLLSKSIETVRLSTNYQATVERARYAPAIQSKIETNDIEELRIRLAESLTFIDDLQTQNKENQKDQANLAAEVEKIYHDGSKLKERFLNTKRAYEDQLSNAQTAYQTLDDKFRDANEKLLLNQTTIRSLNIQLATAAGEIDMLSDENETLKKQLSERKKLLVKSRHALEQSKHQIAESKINMKRLLNELEAAKSVNVQPTPTTLEKMSSENASLKQQIQDLSDKNEQLENQIMDLNRDKEFDGSTIYEVKLDDTSPKRNRKYDDIIDQNELLKQKVDEWQEKYQDQQEVIKQQDARNKETEDKLNNSLETIRTYDQLFGQFNMAPSDLPQVVSYAAEHEQLTNTVQRLRSSLDALCRFTKKLIEDDTADPKLITDRNAPILTDEELKQEVISKIEELQDYAHKLSEEDLDTVLLYDAIFGFGDNIQALVENTVLKRENNIYSGLIILVSILNKSQKFLGQINSDLSCVFKLLPFKKEEQTVVDVIDYIKSLQPSLKRVKSMLKKEFGKVDAKVDIAEQFTTFMDLIEDMVSQLNTDVRDTLGFKKDITQIPEEVCKEIEKLRSQNEEIISDNDANIRDTVNKYNSRVAELEKELEVIKNRESVTIRFQDILQRKDGEIKKQKEEISEAQNRILELESENDALKTKSDEMEMNSTVYKTQRDRLQELLNNKNKSYEKTVKDLMDKVDERTNAEIEIRMKRYKGETEELKKKLETTSKELRDAKNAIKDSNESYEALVQHQRSEMSALVEQNSRLSKKLAKYKTLALNKQANEENKQLQENIDAILNDGGNNTTMQAGDSSKMNDTAGNSTFINQNSSIHPVTNRGVKTPPPNVENLSAISSARSENNNNNNNNKPSIISRTPNANTGGNVNLTARQMQQVTMMQEQMKAQIKEIQQSASTRAAEAVKDLLNEIVQVLIPYSGVKPNWTRARVVSTVKELVTKSTGQSVNADDEWKKWAAGILVSSKGNMSPEEMRSMIKDMVGSKENPSRLKLMEKLKSLRDQKRFLLLRANLPKKTDPLVVNMKTLLEVVTMAKKLTKKKDQARKNQNLSLNQRNLDSFSAIESPPQNRPKTPVK